MKKNHKIAIISLSAIAAIIAGIVLFFSFRKKKKTAADKMRELEAQMRIPKDLNTTTTNITATAVDAGAVSSPAERMAHLRWLGMSGADVALTMQPPNVMSADNADLISGCKILIDRLPDTDLDKSSLSREQYTARTFKLLVDVWLGKIKKDLDDITTVINKNDLTIMANDVYKKVVSLGTSKPVISYADAADGLVWLDVIIRQAILKEKYNYLVDVLVNRGALAPGGIYINKWSFPWNAASMPTDAARKVFIQGNMDNYTFQLAASSGDFIEFESRDKKSWIATEIEGKDIVPGGVKTYQPWLHNINQYIVYMGDNSGRSGTEKAVAYNEAIVNDTLNNMRKLISPTPQEIAMQEARRKQELQTFITIAKLLFAL